MADAPGVPGQAAGGEDLVSVVRRDHEEIKALITAVESSAAAARRDPFEQLVRKLAVHETAEEEIVRPLVRTAGGDQVADERNREEAGAKETLSRLERIGVGAEEFPALFETLKAQVLAHAEREEREEHPLLRQAQSAERLRSLATAFRAAEAVAPTHPHPRGPQSAIGNVLVGPAAAVADRARDAVRSALRRLGSS